MFLFAVVFEGQKEIVVTHSSLVLFSCILQKVEIKLLADKQLHAMNLAARFTLAAKKLSSSHINNYNVS